MKIKMYELYFFMYKEWLTIHQLGIVKTKKESCRKSPVKGAKIFQNKKKKKTKYIFVKDQTFI